MLTGLKPLRRVGDLLLAALSRGQDDVVHGRKSRPYRLSNL